MAWDSSALKIQHLGDEATSNADSNLAYYRYGLPGSLTAIYFNIISSQHGNPLHSKGMDVPGREAPVLDLREGVCEPLSAFFTLMINAHGSFLHRVRYPRPMADREYVYARRVWHRQADGGAYIINTAAKHPEAPQGHKAVNVTDYVSCTAVRAADAPQGSSGEFPNPLLPSPDSAYHIPF